VRREPVVSVITCVYNGLPYLPQAIQSVLGQTFADFEYLVIDDGSTDGSGEKLVELARSDPRLTLLRNEANMGFARSQNRGISAARGRYVACQDQDDLSDRRRFERQVAFLEEHPQVGALGTWPQFIDQQGAPLDNGRYPLLADNDSLQRQLITGCGFAGPSLMIRRELLIALGGYDPAMSAAEDYDLLLRLAEVAQVGNLPELLYQYRSHPASVSKTRAQLQLHNIAASRARAAQRRYGASVPPELETVIARTFLRAALIGLAGGGMTGAGRSIEQAIAHDPSILQSGSLIEVEVDRWLRNQQPGDRLRLLDLCFREQLPPTKHLARVHARLRSQVHMQAVFSAAAHGDRMLVREHWWPAVSANPRWLLNRGVWAIGLRQWLGLNRSGSPAEAVGWRVGQEGEIGDPVDVGDPLLSEELRS